MASNCLKSLWIACSLLFLCNLASSNSLQIDQCLGIYCGRINGTGDCGRCPRGFKTDGINCQKCSNDPLLYDWLYLAFMALITTIMHWTFIYHHGKEQRFIIVLQLSALLESVLAGIFTLLFTEPTGSLTLKTCGVEQLSDWYTVFFNPKPNHVDEVHCTQEAVYPLYSVVLYYYAMSVLVLLVFRPLISWKYCSGEGKLSIYSALYFLPVTVMIHATTAGLIYYSYPYILLIGSLLSTAILLAKKKITSLSEVLENKDVLLIIIGHWFLHAFALIAITKWNEPKTHGPLFLLVIFPSLFYLLTVKLSDPRKFKMSFS